MPLYPICVSCHGAESEVDVDGVCAGCSTRGSAPKTRVEPPPRLAPPSPAPDATRTEPSTDPAAPDAGPRVPGSLADRFPDYADIVPIGRGGMGVVYRARQVRTGRTVALKTINAVAVGDGRHGRRFRTEAEALARLSHPGVVQIYEANERDGVPYIAMEFVPGLSLAQRLRTGPPVSPREAAELAAGVASGLAAAHARGITHRDVKPGNVLLTESGKPKLTDFGLACLDDAATRLTQPGSTIGTPAYMAPEQADPKVFGPVGPAADVYGLGVTLYELLTGRQPFAGDTSVEILYKVCHEAVVPPRTHNPAVPKDLETICLRCLEKRVGDRYASAALLANALSRFLRGEPVGRPTLAFRVRKLVRRYGKIAAGLVAVVGLAWAAGVIPKRAQADPAVTYLRGVVDRLRAGEEVELLTPGEIPPYYSWAAGATALEAKFTSGRDGSLTFQSAGTAHLELLPDTLTESYRVVVRLRHNIDGIPEGRVGVFLRNTPNEYMDRWQFVSFREYENSKSRPQDGTRLKVEDCLTLFKGLDPQTSSIDSAGSEPYTPFGSGIKPYRDLTVTVSPERIEAQMFGLNPDRNGRTDRTASKSILSQFTPDHVALLRGMIDNPLLGNRPAPTVGQPLTPISARGSLGIAVEKTSVAVQSVRVKLIPESPRP
jgi:hypothetical protein